MRKKVFFSLLLCCCSAIGFAGDLPDSIQKALDKAGTDMGRIGILLNASSSAYNPDPDLGTKYAGMALSLSRKVGSKSMEAKSYYRLGTNAYSAKTLDKSLAWFLKASALYDSLHDAMGMAECYSALGDVIGDEGDGKKSIEYYTKAKEKFLIIKDTVHAIYMDMSIAGTLGSMNFIDSALRYSLSILPKAQRTMDDGLVNMILGNIASAYKVEKEYNKALDYYVRSLPYFEKRGDQGLEAISFGNIADCYRQMNDYANAEKYAMLQYENYKTAKSQSGLVKAMQQLGNIFMQKKDYEKSAIWYQNASLAQDTLFTSDMAARMADMQTKYETVKKDKELVLQTAKLDRQQLIIYGSTVFLILILLASLVLFVNYRKINRLSKALSAQKIELEELNNIKDKLFSAISHDLRSPLGRITNMLYMMQRGNMTEEKLKERTSDFLSTMQQTMQLLDNLLYWATGQMNSLSLNKSNINIAEVVEENIDLMQAEATLKNITLAENLKGQVMANADINMTRLILRNLISNAIKFTHANGSVTISAEKMDMWVKIEVADTGIGMDKETVEALYNGFQVKSQSGTLAEKGFGIGLQLCKDFIEKNGGRLEVQSEKGKGSIFSFTLPISV